MTDERLDKHEQLLTKLAELITAIAKARKTTNPAYPFHPALRLNDGMKLVKEITEIAGNLGIIAEEPSPEPEITDPAEDLTQPDENDTTPDPDDN